MCSVLVVDNGWFPFPGLEGGGSLGAGVLLFFVPCFEAILVVGFEGSGRNLLG